MLPYKSIDIPEFNEIQEQLKILTLSVFTDFSINSAKKIEKDLIISACPKLKTFLDENNLIWDIARIFVTAPHNSIAIHLDGDYIHPKFLALNLPIMNCNNSEMQWWLNAEFSHNITDNIQYSTVIPIYKKNQDLPDYSLELLNPHLVQINIPHGVVNNNNVPRAILSIRFIPEPLHLWSNG